MWCHTGSLSNSRKRISKSGEDGIVIGTGSNSLASEIKKLLDDKKLII